MQSEAMHSAPPPAHLRQPADLLIEARWVLPIGPRNIALRDHAVAVTEGRISAIGPIAELNARCAPRERITRREHALLPGLVNAHTRIGNLLLRGRVPLAPLSLGADADGVRDAAGIDAEHVRQSARIAIAEMLRAGITTFATVDVHAAEVASIAAQARVRAAIGTSVGAGSAASGRAPNELERAERLWDQYKSNPWVSLYFAPAAAPTLEDTTLAHLRTIADELDARIAMPVHQATAEIALSGARTGRRPLQRLQDLGLLRPGFLALHLNHVEESELDLVARTGISVVACPQSDLRLGNGYCPVSRLLARDVTAGLGSGSPESVGALDMLAEARTSALLASGLQGQAELAAESALFCATLGGATALGLSSAIGSLEPGKLADLIAIDLSSISCQPAELAADAVLFGATREHVSDVWISGRPQLAQGRLLSFDEPELLGAARSWPAYLPRLAEPPR
jgi:5-methylthioadenosine/S-adenosylhomocysteine deaminase